MREHPKLQALRDKLAEIEEAEATDNLHYTKELNKAIQAINFSLAGLRSEYGIETANGIPLSPIVRLGNAVLAAQSIPPAIPDLGIKLPGSRVSSAYRARGYRGFLRSVIADLSSVARLGHLHERICKNVRRTRDAHAVDVQIEDPRFRYARPDWKRPM